MNWSYFNDMAEIYESLYACKSLTPDDIAYYTMKINQCNEKSGFPPISPEKVEEHWNNYQTREETSDESGGELYDESSSY